VSDRLRSVVGCPSTVALVVAGGLLSP